MLKSCILGTRLGAGTLRVRAVCGGHVLPCANVLLSRAGVLLDGTLGTNEAKRGIPVRMRKGSAVLP